MSIQNEIEQLKAKRVKFRTAGLICGFAALTVGFWGSAVLELLGGLVFFVWLALLICGFVFRSAAVNARERAKFLEMQLAAQGLTPNLSPINAVPIADQVQVAQPVPAAAPSAAPAQAKATKAPEANIEGRLAKARRVNN